MNDVTLIMPVYNAENCLKQSIESILNQSFEDFELICVDENSTDNSLKLLMEYSLEDSRIIINHDEKECIQSLNEIITQVSGKYILFADSNNILEENILEKIHKKVKKNTPDLLLLNSRPLNHKYNQISKYLALYHDKTFNHNQIGDLIFNLNNSLFNVVIQKEFLLNNKIFFNTEQFTDYETFFYKALLHAEKISYYKEQVYKKETQKINKNDIKQFEKCLKTQNNILKVFNQPEYIQQAINNKINNTINQYNKICISDKKHAYQLLREDYLKLLNQKDSEKFVSLLDEENHKRFEQIIITETVEEYELLKSVYQDKKTINYNKRYEKILKKEHKKIKMFNDSLKSSKSWKLTKIFRLR